MAEALPVCCETTVTPFWRVEVLTPSAVGVNSIACGVSGNSSTIADMLESERVAAYAVGGGGCDRSEVAGGGYTGAGGERMAWGRGRGWRWGLRRAFRLEAMARRSAAPSRGAVVAAAAPAPVASSAWGAALTLAFIRATERMVFATAAIVAIGIWCGQRGGGGGGSECGSDVRLSGRSWRAGPHGSAGLGSVGGLAPPRLGARANAGRHAWPSCCSAPQRKKPVEKEWGATAVRTRAGPRS